MSRGHGHDHDLKKMTMLHYIHMAYQNNQEKMTNLFMMTMTMTMTFFTVVIVMVMVTVMVIDTINSLHGFS